MLLAAPLAPRQDGELWRRYRSREAWLAGVCVADPFMGGGTTLLEAARLGADLIGADIDPVAIAIGEHQLNPPAVEDVQAAGARLLADLRERLGHLWPNEDPAWDSLHYFTIATVTCPSCSTPGHLYRSIVLARSTGAAGAVVRDTDQSVFCPICLRVHSLARSAKRLHCCQRYTRLDAATFRGGRYHCRCGHAATLESLKAGAAPRVMLAVEDAARRGTARRRLRAPGPLDQQEAAADVWLAENRQWQPPDRPFTGSIKDNRPVSFGVTSYRHLFTSRQWALLTAANRWLQEANLDPAVSRALRLAVSNAILSNNRLCGYARDYGRLAPLFSVRAFSLPALSVELNPLARHGGRGTLATSLRKVAASCTDQVTRTVRDGTSTKAVAMTLPRSGGGTLNHQDSAPITTTAPRSTGTPATVATTLIVTDPPYFDYIEYSNLSQVFTPWLGSPASPAAALLPEGEDGVGSFTARLTTAFTSAVAEAAADPLVAFTCKGSHRAWAAVTAALTGASLAVTAAWPVLADPHMGHHAHAGNCEFDILIVTRRNDRAVAGAPVPDPQDWVRRMAEVRQVSPADQAGFDRAVQALSACWAIPAADTHAAQRQRTSPVTSRA